MRWYAQDEVNQEDSEQNEVDGMKKGADSTYVEGDSISALESQWQPLEQDVKERLVICNEEDTDGQRGVSRHRISIWYCDITCQRFAFAQGSSIIVVIIIFLNTLGSKDVKG